MVHGRWVYMEAYGPRVNGNSPGCPRATSASKSARWSAVYTVSKGVPDSVRSREPLPSVIDQHLLVLTRIPARTFVRSNAVRLTRAVRRVLHASTVTDRSGSRLLRPDRVEAAPPAGPPSRWQMMPGVSGTIYHRKHHTTRRPQKLEVHDAHANQLVRSSDGRTAGRAHARRGEPRRTAR